MPVRVAYRPKSARARQKVNPRKVKKASETRKKYAHAQPGVPADPSSAQAIGFLASHIDDREKTEFGYRVEIEKGKYEVYHYVFASSVATPKWLHEKKSRSFFVLSGVGGLQTEDQDQETGYTRLHVGVHCTVAPGVPYQLFVGGNQPLEVLVVQERSYEARLKRVEEGTPAEFGEDLGVDATEVELKQVLDSIPPRRKKSKAAQQELKRRIQNQQRKPPELQNSVTTDLPKETPDSRTGTTITKDPVTGSSLASAPTTQGRDGRVSSRPDVNASAHVGVNPRPLSPAELEALDG